jgi:adenylate cyclase
MTDHRVERRLAAILAADVVGYSRLVAANEAGTLSALRVVRADLMDPSFDQYGGRIVKTMGDGLLLEFSSGVEATRFAIGVQVAMAARNTGTPDERRIAFRIGINLGDILVEGDDIFGDGVNVAARLQEAAAVGGVAISRRVHEDTRDRIESPFRDIGPRNFKNIARPVEVWCWEPGSGAAPVDPPHSRAAPAADFGKPSIAVLPFDNMSGDVEQDYFADGITEDIITDLSRVSGLHVIARNSSFAYRARDRDLRAICRDLSVRFILEGSVRKASNRVRVNAQLIDGSTLGHLWAARYDRDLADIFAVQDEVTREIVTALRVALTDTETRRRQATQRVDPEAYDLFVHGRERVFGFSAASMAEAEILLNRAIARDPTLAIARAYLSLVHCTNYLNRWNGADHRRLEEAQKVATQACQDDPSGAEAFNALALSELWLGRIDAAEAAGEKAVELNANFAGGYSGLGQVRDLAGRHEAAIDCFATVLRLDPHYDIAYQLLGRAQFALGRDAAARKNFEERLARRPNSDMSRAYLAALDGLAGRIDEGRKLLAELFAINPDFSVAFLRKVMPYRNPAVLDRLEDGLRKVGYDK